MKKNALTSLMKISGLMLAMFVAFTSCEKDDPKPDPVLVEDGFYVKGSLTPYAEIEFNGSFVAGKNEVDQAARTGMYEKYVALKAGAEGFNIHQVSGQDVTIWGPSSVEVLDITDITDNPAITIQKGTLGNSGVFTVPTDGLYHIILDTETSTFVIAPVPYWAIIGGATPIGWTDSQMPLVGDFGLNEIKFELTDIELRAGDFKFRYGNGWKINITDDETVKVNTNYGGTVSGTLPDLVAELIPGGDNYALTKEQEGIYTVTLTWNAESGYTSTLTKTADVTPLDYPENLYMIGDGVGDWEWANTDLPLVPTHSNPHLFWKIVWMNAEGGFKFAPEKEWAGDFGISGDADENGVYAKGGDNVSVPGTAGYYMVVVDLENETIQVTDVKVYGIGDAFGVWDAATEANLFTIDGESIYFNSVPAAGDLRMHVTATTLSNIVDGEVKPVDWWQAEFNIIDGSIAFRGTGGDQTGIPAITAGQKVTLNFKQGTGTIE